ncbi:PLP-dependent aminotransferase family protein [Mesorhizobium sp. B4-1-4]|uniref:aminotransferase-like domain-containing protein n=1 Tax=Mesorhizobium sp. B4-1-4 TaxID=2589888 RepID=UPI001D006F58|nr:PLP-dependent aminotransferase family protein [Mesorhizobium sp. B4-1-4]UCI32036.1 PLP-dependent aminotransferase family protein [Mesorhizobium sp. B4-1-4]
MTIDLTRTVAPRTPLLQSIVSEALGRLMRRKDLAEALRLHHFHGTDSERDIAARWVGRRLDLLSPERLLLTSGTQITLQILFAALATEGRPILSEALSYTPVEQISSRLDLRNIGVSIDDEGLIPEAFNDACRRHGPALVYCNPTLHNPTTSVMPLERRQAIAEIARRHNVTIIEDDVHGMLDDVGLPPLSALAPERSWYLQTLSKTVGLGLRETILVCPDPVAAQKLIASAPVFSGWFVPALSAMLLADLMEGGEIDLIVRDVGEEIRRRQYIAASILGHVPGLRTKRTAMNVWLPLSPGRSMDDVVLQAEKHGVCIRHSRFYATRDRPVLPHAVRLSVTAPDSSEDLARGLEIVKGLCG